MWKRHKDSYEIMGTVNYLININGQSSTVGEAVATSSAHIFVPGLTACCQQAHLLHLGHPHLQIHKRYVEIMLSTPLSRYLYILISGSACHSSLLHYVVLELEYVPMQSCTHTNQPTNRIKKRHVLSGLNRSVLWLAASDQLFEYCYWLQISVCKWLKTRTSE